MDMDFYNAETGVLKRSIFADEGVYELELKRIFARAWNFMCHESQIPEPGDFFMNYIGEDEVIVVRGRDRRVNVLLNTCAHRGNSVCRAELGNVRSFFCSYHGWNYDLDGSLIGVRGEDVFYRGNLDRKAWGLTPAAQVASYRGFVFATLDPGAPALEEYLGWVGRLGIDLVASRGEVEFLDGVRKNRVKCNWKLAVDNLYDWYHVQVSHGSALKVGVLREESLRPMKQIVVLGDYGHGIGGPGLSEDEFDEAVERVKNGGGKRQFYDGRVAERMAPATQRQLGPVGKRVLGHPNIFPNLWISSTPEVCLRIPRGPDETELWWFAYRTRDMDERKRRAALHVTNHLFAPGGLLEQDDAENWSHATRSAKGRFARQLPLNFTMGKGADRVTTAASGQRGIETVVNEHGQRWTWQSWQEWMRAESWQDLMASRSPPPTGVV